MSLTISHIECVSIMFLSLGTNKDYKVDENLNPKKKKKKKKNNDNNNKREEEERVKYSITKGSMIIKYYQ